MDILVIDVEHIVIIELPPPATDITVDSVELLES